MNTAARRRVTPLEEGSLLVAKRMEGAEGISFPGHTASVESVLVVTEGRCVVKFRDADRVLSAGDTFLVPPDEWHQVVADPDFRAVHVMPKEIRFEFST